MVERVGLDIVHGTQTVLCPFESISIALSRKE